MRLPSAIYRVLESSLWETKKTPKEFARQLMDYDVVSFDVFDTLLLRPFPRPEGVFRLVGEEIGRPDFTEIRKRAEQDARKEAFLCSGSYEVTLDEIYRRIEQKMGMPEDIKRLEIQAEEKCCFANPYMKSVVEEVQGVGKRTVVTSDMYLSCMEIRKLLAGAGYGRFGAVYVSAEHRKSKAAGDLFDYVREEWGEQNSFAHVGDNYHSDVWMAKKHGFRAFCYRGEGQKKLSIKRGAAFDDAAALRNGRKE